MEGGLKMDLTWKNLKLQYSLSLLPVLVRDTGYSGIYYAIYQHLRHDKYSVAESAFCAAVLSTVITHPFDVAISEKQIFNSKKSSFWAVFSEGRGFVGLLPRLLRRPISAVVTWFTFEYLK